MWGYVLYDVVAQLEADHVAAADYLRHMVPFRDPLVGFAAGVEHLRNAATSWSARGRAFDAERLHPAATAAAIASQLHRLALGGPQRRAA